MLTNDFKRLKKGLENGDTRAGNRNQVGCAHSDGGHLTNVRDPERQCVGTAQGKRFATLGRHSCQVASLRL